jgi:peptidoglycan/LPS O-acetylase OafA/YrhL
VLKNQSVSETNFYYSFIDGLRGIAVLMVLMVHTSQKVGNEHLGSFHFRLSEIFVNFGARGVQLFFLLSAFTLFNSSRSRYDVDQYPKISFYLRRFFRIMPFWILMIIVMAILTNSINDYDRIFINVTFLFGFVRFIPGIELIPPAWSLFVEETFYLMLPFLYIYIKDIFTAFRFFILTLIIAVIWLLAAYKFKLPNTSEFIFLFPLSHYFAFALGITLYFLIINEKFAKYILDNSKYHFILDSLALISFFIVLFISSIWWTYIVSTFALALIFIASIPAKSLFGRLTRNKLLMRFGVYCYSIYLFHIPLLTLLEPMKNRIFSLVGFDGKSIVELKLLFYFPIVCLFSFCIAFFTFNLIEKPCIIFGKKVIAKINVLISKYI